MTFPGCVMLGELLKITYTGISWVLFWKILGIGILLVGEPRNRKTAGLNTLCSVFIKSKASQPCPEDEMGRLQHLQWGGNHGRRVV